MNTRRTATKDEPVTTSAVPMAPVRCTNSACALNGKNQYAPLDKQECSACKRKTIPLVVIHVIQPDDTGPIRSTVEGIEVIHNFVCERAKKRLKDHPNNPEKHPKFYTGDASCATCYDCLVGLGYVPKEDGTLIKKPTEDDRLV